MSAIQKKNGLESIAKSERLVVGIRSQPAPGTEVKQGHDRRGSLQFCTRHDWNQLPSVPANYRQQTGRNGGCEWTEIQDNLILEKQEGNSLGICVRSLLPDRSRPASLLLPGYVTLYFSEPGCSSEK